MALDISRLTDGVSQLLPPEISEEIWGESQQESAVMRLSRQITIPGRGLTIPVITGDAEAEWVNETDPKPVSQATISSKQLTPYKLAVIEPFSKEFLRDLPGLYEELKRRLPNALAKKFDATVFGTTAPGSNFATLGGATPVALAPKSGDVTKGTWAGLVAASTAVSTADGALNGWALSSQAKSLLLNQVDNTGRPLLADSIVSGTTLPVILGEPVTYTKGVYKAGTPNQIGVAGDWDSTRWGMVAGIEISFTDAATLEDGTMTIPTSGTGANAATVTVPKFIPVWQRNMVALRCEVEIGFQIQDLAKFVRLTDAART